MDLSLVKFLILVALMVFIWILNGRLRAQEQERFLNFARPADDPRLHFEGRSATVLHTFRHMARGAHQGVSRICKNRHCEYFLYISYGPYITHLTQERAQKALRSNRKAFVREFGPEAW